MLPKFNHCESCSMPMLDENEHGGKDKNNTWCIHCCYEDGKHKSFEEVLNGMSNYMFSKEGQELSGITFNSLEEAKKYAKEYLSKMPAWKTSE